ncbi:MAG: NAD(P)-dependent oxidoreductase, partial [Acidimicrobiia bacterium]
MAIAVFGLGEAGSAIAFDLAQAGAEVHGFDPGDVPTPVGVVRHHVPEEAVRDVTLVLAVTAASDARAALGQTLDEIGKGAIYA